MKKSQMIKSSLLKSLLIVFFSLYSFRASAPDIKVAYILVSDRIDVYDKLIKAVVLVESLEIQWHVIFSNRQQEPFR